MTRALLTAALLLTACKGEPARPAAETVTVAPTDAAVTDASSRMSDADFDKVMQEAIAAFEEVLPIVSQSKDCGAVAGAAATTLGKHSDLFVQIQGIPDFETRAKAWLDGRTFNVTMSVLGDMRCLEDPRIKRLFAVALPGVVQSP